MYTNKILIFLLLLTCFASCRKSNLSRTKADSTITRTEQSTASWDRLTVTEIFTGPELSLPEVILPTQDIYGLPVIPFVRNVPSPAPERITTTVRQQRTAKPSKQQLLIRTTTHEKGQVSEQKEEHKQVQIRSLEKEKESGISTNPWFMVVMFCIVLLIVLCIILYHSKKRDY